MQSNKNYKNNFNKDGVQSGFVVDLKKQLIEEEEEINFQEKAEKAINKKKEKFLNFYKKINFLKFFIGLGKKLIFKRRNIFLFCNCKKFLNNLKSVNFKSGFRIFAPLRFASYGMTMRKSFKKICSLHPVVSFAVILLILVLPFKALTYYVSLSDLKVKVLGASGLAIDELFKAGESASEMNFAEASDNFSSAADNFFKAQNDLNNINDLLFSLASLSRDENLKMAADAKIILSAGEKASKVGKELSLAVASLLGNNENIVDRLNDFNKHSKIALDNSKELEEFLNKINVENLPDEYSEKFILMRENAEFLNSSLEEFVDLIDRMKIFLGEENNKRYLLIFQNNTEMRASGGFVGSFALVDFSNGKIKNIEVPGGGSYDTEAGLYTPIIAPEPLHLVNPLWHFWDANWWPDWRKSAMKLAWFYEKSNGPTVDGVISFTPTVIERMLDVIGPVEMEKYGSVISSENFWDITQEIVEKKPDIETTTISTTTEEIKHEPKKIIGDLMGKILEELPNNLNKDKLLDLASIIGQSLDEKHILFYFKNNELQDKISELGWDGRVKQTSRDYLMVINTNIAGGKSDKKIRETINHTAEVLEDGSIINTLEIKREHTAGKGEKFTGVRNVNWIRIYVPIGSELLEASGFEKPDDIYFSLPETGWQSDDNLYAENNIYEIHSESGTKIYEDSWKTVFANWTMMDPGETDMIYLKYKLPFKIEKNEESFNLFEKIKNYFNDEQKQLYPYSFLAQKQSGSLNSSINSKLKLPNNFKPIWNYPDELEVDDAGLAISDDLSMDKYWAVLLEKN
ncbi:MAG: DUF4012 domain-containing protein [Candidatus Falkowbacteria bacterium]